ncbi:probable serine/threonine-protein kinase nek3 [Chelonus insularis]|uniref:probable serine/threonine-protein kinase nek3 n=1 Tax=Chelonus insularis TaxID=460826 RepID=UPI00158ADA59|nr:probable serine/threonine-protein kinase nek3 [Chelonus insularis]
MYSVRWFLLLLFNISQSFSASFELKAGPNDTSNRSRIFSPRMDYDEWTPLGRGDPLKNDPTFDYVPPVLDRVQYWLDSQSSTEASSSKRDILVLGVTAKKTSPKIPEHFFKFIDAPKFNKNQHESSNFRKDFTGSTGAEPPKIVRVTKFRGGNSASPLDLRSQNRIQSIPASYYASPYYGEKMKHFTMMVPPPMMNQAINHQFGGQTEETPISLLRPEINREHSNSHPLISQGISKDVEQSTTSVTFDKSNLVYQSTQTFDSWTAANSNHNPSILWNENNHKSIEHDEDHQIAGSVNHEVVVSQNANIIVDESEENEQVVLGKKETIYTPIFNHSDLNNNNKQLESDDEKMHIVLPNMPPANDEVNNKTMVTVIMPTNYPSSSNQSKTSNRSEVISTTPVPLNISMPTRMPIWKPPSKAPPQALSKRPGMLMIPNNNNNIHRPVQKPPHVPSSPPEMIMMHSMTMNRMPSASIQPMFPSLSPPSTSSVFSPPASFHRPENMIDMIRPTTSVHSPLAMLLDAENIEKMTTAHSSSMRLDLPSSTSAPQASITPSSIKTTSDPTFPHVKQSSKPNYSPMYLIIQGHSKVKTYKPTVNKYGVPVENNAIVETTTSRPISKFEQFVNDNTRVVPTEKTITKNNHEVKAKEKRVGHDSLLSFVESGLSAFTVPSSSSSSSSLRLMDEEYNRFHDDLSVKKQYGKMK